MNRVIVLIILLFLFLTACKTPSSTASPLPSPSRTPIFTPNSNETPLPLSTPVEPFQATMRANQTQNANYNATIEAKGTATGIALATLRSLPPTETLTLTPTATHTPSNTPMPSPTTVPPLIAHTWSPATVLVLYESFGGDGGSLHPLPRLVLYGDGQLFKENLTKQLTRQEMCNFLNTIDQLGYLYYSPDTYMQDLEGKAQENLNFDGSGTARIHVNIWDGIFGQYYGLFYAVYFDYSYPICPECERAPTVYPALANTFLLLENYQPEGMEVYVPQKMEIWVESTQVSSDIPDWPLSTIRLADLSSSDNLAPEIITGGDAKQIYENIWLTDIGPFFSEDGLDYYVTIRPVYPYPWNTNEKYPGIPDTLTCAPEDGVLEISLEK